MYNLVWGRVWIAAEMAGNDGTKRTRRRRVLLIGLASLLILGVALYALAPHPPGTPDRVADTAALGAYLERLVASGSPPGLSIIGVKEGSVVLNEAFGVADSLGAPATPDTVYHWWSMTKIVTAIAVLQLLDRGALGLDDPVSTHLPWFDVDEAITLRHLLQHTSGLPDTIPAMIGWVHYDDELRDQTAIARAQFPKYGRLRFTPGTRARYSNLNYMLLGAVIEAVAEQPYEIYVREHILEPLGMEQTDFVVTKSMAFHEAAGTLPVIHPFTPLMPALLNFHELVRERRGKLLWMKRVYIDATPSTGLIGPATDVARLMLACLDGATLDGVTILTPESHGLLMATSPIDGRGLGWSVGESEGRSYVEHAGGGPGFATIMRLYPDERLGVAILSNGTDLDRDGWMDVAAAVLR